MDILPDPADVDAALRTRALATEQAMAAYLDGWHTAPRALVDAIRYSLFAGGKRLRPALALLAAEAVGGTADVAMPAACALEMVHTYSLIHDDLPAMDNDDLRRGRPTLHKHCDEATAILAGDTLLTMAFDVLAEAGRTDVIQELARAAGATGMAGGQYLDLQGEGKALGVDAMQAIHRAKTGALIRASLRMGAMLADASAAQLDALTAYGEAIGLAFQIADDILDVIGDEAALGKPIGSDAIHAKSTYPALLGLEESRRLAEEATNTAIEALAPFGEAAATLRALARFIVDRKN